MFSAFLSPFLTATFLIVYYEGLICNLYFGRVFVLTTKPSQARGLCDSPFMAGSCWKPSLLYSSIPTSTRAEPIKIHDAKIQERKAFVFRGVKVVSSFQLGVTCVQRSLKVIPIPWLVPVGEYVPKNVDMTPEDSIEWWPQWWWVGGWTRFSESSFPTLTILWFFEL